MKVQPYLQRLGLTSGQAWTLSIGLFLGVLLIVVSVPPVWARRVSPPEPPPATDVTPLPNRVVPLLPLGGSFHLTLPSEESR